MNKIRRSQATRDRILAAARRLFGDKGFERTTIRMVGSAAKIHPSMVMRYYESKEKLFAASAVFDLELPDLRDHPRQGLGRLLVGHFLTRWEMKDQELPALLRMAVTHDTARQRLLQILTDQIKPTIAQVCQAKQAQVTTALVVTQMIGLAFTRYVLCLPPVAALPREILIARVGDTLQAYLDGVAGETDGADTERVPHEPRRTVTRISARGAGRNTKAR